jgi:hypothetical protein
LSVTTILRCRWIGTLFLGFIALSVAILAALLFPGQAQAQEQATPKITTKLVQPGDSLWTIAQARLSPDAAPQQVAEEVGRIYELNRDQIGENPNLIFPGQEFFLVPAAPSGAAAAPEQPVAVAEQQQAAKPIVVESEGVSDSPAAPAAEDAAIENVVPEDGVSEGAVSEDAIPAATPTRDQTDEQAESAPAQSAPAESTPAESESAAPTTTAGSIVDSVLEALNNLKGERRLLGVGILALTLIVALLMAWRLPMRRNVEDPQAWGLPQQYYYENYAPAEAPRQAPPETAREPAGEREGEPSGAASGSALGPPPEEATPEPSVSSSTSPAAANGAEEDVVAEDSDVAESSDVTEDRGVAASSPDRERLRGISQLRRISQRRSPSGWRGG